MKTNIKSVLLGICVLFVFANGNAQQIRESTPTTSGGVTYTLCHDYSRAEPNTGAKVNGKMVVPCKYYFVFGRGSHLFAYTTSNHYAVSSADVYSQTGQLLFTADKGIEDVFQFSSGISRFQAQDFSIYNEDGKFLFNPQEKLCLTTFCHSFVEISGGEIVLCVGRDNHLYDAVTGKKLIIYETIGYNLMRFNDIITKGENGAFYIKVQRDYKHGISELLSGEEILAPEFQDCDYLGSNLFKFKMNGYWGVINKDGKVIIPLDRHYTKIEYSRTLKMFTFEKEGGYKGECDATGKQTNITKVSTPAPKPQPQQQKTTTQEPAPAPTPTPQTQPQPRQPQPVQEWVPCSACNGSGQCHICLGGGNSLQNPNSRCYLCSGTGKCTHCAGHGGHYETRYR